jgi:hypothetical protein
VSFAEIYVHILNNLIGKTRQHICMGEEYIKRKGWYTNKNDKYEGRP